MTDELQKSNHLSLKLQKYAQNQIPYNLTNDQQNALVVISDLISGVRNEQIVVLKGYAGTGKSSIIAAIIKSINIIGMQYRLIAPTGKAAKILSTFSGRPATTIHHQIFEIAQVINDVPQFRLKLENEENTIFIIDEASMISDNPPALNDIHFGKIGLLSEMLNYIFGGSNNKLIFIGDPCQLPPVKSDFSFALNENYLTEKFHKTVRVLALETVVRQKKDSGILRFALDIRNAMDLGGKVKSINIPNQGDTLNVSVQEFENVYQNSLKNVGLSGTTILVYRNHTVDQRNQQVRRKILGHESVLVPDEPLLVVSNNYYWQKINQLDYLANGEIVIISKTGQENSLGRYHFKQASIYATGFTGDTSSLSGYLFLNSLNPSLGTITSRDRADLFRCVSKKYPRLMGNELRTAVFTDPYFNALQVQYGYALTVHKSQGSQWQNVFLDLSDWAWFYHIAPSAALRWLYTGVTRAKNRLYLLGLPNGNNSISLN